MKEDLFYLYIILSKLLVIAWFFVAIFGSLFGYLWDGILYEMIKTLSLHFIAIFIGIISIHFFKVFEKEKYSNTKNFIKSVTLMIIAVILANMFRYF